MIAWMDVAAGALWILGLSIALATLSYASWQASIFEQKLRQRLALPGAQKAFSLAGLLFCAGLAASAGSPLETAIWVVLGVCFAVLLAALILRARPQPQVPQEPGS
jgi:hypothetical protein